jgi:hypothetical protein
MWNRDREYEFYIIHDTVNNTYRLHLGLIRERGYY